VIGSSASLTPCGEIGPRRTTSVSISNQRRRSCRSHIITLRTFLRICKARYTLNLPTRAQLREMVKCERSAYHPYTHAYWWEGEDLVFWVTDSDDFDLEVRVKPSGEVSHSY